MSIFIKFFKQNWQIITGAVIVSILIFGLLGYRIGDLTPGLSTPEIEFIDSSITTEKILDSPTNIPQKASIFVLNQFNLLTIASARLISAFLAIITIVVFYLLLSRWHTVRISLLACTLLIISSWFIGLGRLATAQILLVLGVMVAIYISELLKEKDRKSLTKGIALLALFGFALYIPGLIWVLIGLIILHKKDISKIISDLSLSYRLLGLLIGSILLVPVIALSISDINFLTTILAIPDELMITEWLRRLVVIPIYMFAQGPLDPTTNLSRLPLLDIFSSVTLVFGVYAYYFKQKLSRTRTLVIIFCVGSIIIALNGAYFMPLLLPIIFIVMASGIELLLQQWLTIFPKNPLAQKLGVSLVLIAIMFTGIYHIQRYFVAWSGSVETHEEFIHTIDE